MFIAYKKPVCYPADLRCHQIIHQHNLLLFTLEKLPMKFGQIILAFSPFTEPYAQQGISKPCIIKPL